MHLPIRVVGRSQPVEVPFQLQSSFSFGVYVPGLGVREFVADLTSRDVLAAKVARVESKRADTLTGYTLHDAAVFARAKSAAEGILSAVLSRLGLVELDGERKPRVIPRDSLMWVGIAHEAEERTANACKAALVHLTPVWRDRTEPAPKPHVAADILDSYYQQVQDEVIGEWESKADHEMRDALLAASDKLTERQASGDSEVQP